MFKFLKVFSKRCYIELFILIVICLHQSVPIVILFTLCSCFLLKETYNNSSVNNQLLFGKAVRVSFRGNRYLKNEAKPKYQYLACAGQPEILSQEYTKALRDGNWGVAGNLEEKFDLQFNLDPDDIKRRHDQKLINSQSMNPQDSKYKKEGKQVIVKGNPKALDSPLLTDTVSKTHIQGLKMAGAKSNFRFIQQQKQAQQKLPPNKCQPDYTSNSIIATMKTLSEQIKDFKVTSQYAKNTIRSQTQQYINSKLVCLWKRARQVFEKHPDAPTRSPVQIAFDDHVSKYCPDVKPGAYFSSDYIPKGRKTYQQRMEDKKSLIEKTHQGKFTDKQKHDYSDVIFNKSILEVRDLPESRQKTDEINKRRELIRAERLAEKTAYKEKKRLQNISKRKRKIHENGTSVVDDDYVKLCGLPPRDGSFYQMILLPFNGQIESVCPTMQLRQVLWICMSQQYQEYGIDISSLPDKPCAYFNSINYIKRIPDWVYSQMAYELNYTTVLLRHKVAILAIYAKLFKLEPVLKTFLYCDYQNLQLRDVVISPDEVYIDLPYSVRVMQARKVTTATLQMITQQYADNDMLVVQEIAQYLDRNNKNFVQQSLLVYVALHVIQQLRSVAYILMFAFLLQPVQGQIIEEEPQNDIDQKTATRVAVIIFLFLCFGKTAERYLQLTFSLWQTITEVICFWVMISLDFQIGMMFVLYFILKIIITLAYYPQKHIMLFGNNKLKKQNDAKERQQRYMSDMQLLEKAIKEGLNIDPNLVAAYYTYMADKSPQNYDSLEIEMIISVNRIIFPALSMVQNDDIQFKGGVNCKFVDASYTAPTFISGTTFDVFYPPLITATMNCTPLCISLITGGYAYFHDPTNRRPLCYHTPNVFFKTLKVNWKDDEAGVYLADLKEWINAYKLADLGGVGSKFNIQSKPLIIVNGTHTFLVMSKKFSQLVRTCLAQPYLTYSRYRNIYISIYNEAPQYPLHVNEDYMVDHKFPEQFANQDCYLNVTDGELIRWKDYTYRYIINPQYDDMEPTYQGDKLSFKINDYIFSGCILHKTLLTLQQYFFMQLQNILLKAQIKVDIRKDAVIYMKEIVPIKEWKNIQYYRNLESPVIVNNQEQCSKTLNEQMKVKPQESIVSNTVKDIKSDLQIGVISQLPSKEINLDQSKSVIRYDPTDIVHQHLTPADPIEEQVVNMFQNVPVVEQAFYKKVLSSFIQKIMKIFQDNYGSYKKSLVWMFIILYLLYVINHYYRVFFTMQSAFDQTPSSTQPLLYHSNQEDKALYITFICILLLLGLYLFIYPYVYIPLFRKKGEQAEGSIIIPANVFLIEDGQSYPFYQCVPGQNSTFTLSEDKLTGYSQWSTDTGVEQIVLPVYFTEFVSTDTIVKVKGENVFIVKASPCCPGVYQCEIEIVDEKSQDLMNPMIFTLIRQGVSWMMGMAPGSVKDTTIVNYCKIIQETYTERGGIVQQYLPYDPSYIATAVRQEYDLISLESQNRDRVYNRYNYQEYQYLDILNKYFHKGIIVYDINEFDKAYLHAIVNQSSMGVSCVIILITLILHKIDSIGSFFGYDIPLIETHIKIAIYIILFVIFVNNLRTLTVMVFNLNDHAFTVGCIDTRFKNKIYTRQVTRLFNTEFYPWIQNFRNPQLYGDISYGGEVTLHKFKGFLNHNFKGCQVSIRMALQYLSSIPSKYQLYRTNVFRYVREYIHNPGFLKPSIVTEHYSGIANCIARHLGTMLSPDPQVVLDFKLFQKRFYKQFKQKVLQIIPYVEFVDINSYIQQVEAPKRQSYIKGLEQFREYFRIPNTATIFAKKGEIQFTSSYSQPGVQAIIPNPKSKERCIFNPNQVTKCIGGFINYNAIILIKHLIPGFLHGKNCTELSDTFSAIIEGTQTGIFDQLGHIGDFKVVASDVASFDSRQDLQFMWFENQVIKYVVKQLCEHFDIPMEYQQAMIKYVRKSDVLNVNLTAPLKQVFRGVQLQKFSIKGTTYSGHPWKTTFGNTLRMLQYVYFTATQAKLPMRYIRPAVAGDDCTVFINTKYVNQYVKQFKTYTLDKEPEQPRQFGLGIVLKQIDVMTPLKFFSLSKTWIYDKNLYPHCCIGHPFINNYISRGSISDSHCSDDQILEAVTQAYLSEKGWSISDQMTELFLPNRNQRLQNKYDMDRAYKLKQVHQRHNYDPEFAQLHSSSAQRALVLTKDCRSDGSIQWFLKLSPHGERDF